MTHNTPQPPEHEEPETAGEKLNLSVVMELLSLSPYVEEDIQRAYEILDRLMLHAYASGREDEAGDVQDGIASLVAAQTLAHEQAEDEGLWFIARTAPEAYLQQELRKLHAVIEGRKDEAEWA